MKQAPTITDFPLPGMTYEESLEALHRVRSKGDLREWTGSLPFHLNRDPIEPNREKRRHCAVTGA